MTYENLQFNSLVWGLLTLAYDFSGEATYLNHAITMQWPKLVLVRQCVS